jgi:hypothetical protein
VSKQKLCHAPIQCIRRVYNLSKIFPAFKHSCQLIGATTSLGGPIDQRKGAGRTLTCRDPRFRAVAYDFDTHIVPNIRSMPPMNVLRHAEPLLTQTGDG